MLGAIAEPPQEKPTGQNPHAASTSLQLGCKIPPVSDNHTRATTVFGFGRTIGQLLCQIGDPRLGGCDSKLEGSHQRLGCFLCGACVGGHFGNGIQFFPLDEVELADRLVHAGTGERLCFVAQAGQGGHRPTGNAGEVVEEAGTVSHDGSPVAAFVEDGCLVYAQHRSKIRPSMFPILLFPQFDPVLVSLGPLSIRWYALAYISALVLGWRLVRRWVTLSPVVATPLQADDFLTWATLGVVLGGRLGYVLFYQPEHFLAEPLQIFAVWTGGMSFHGGMLGVSIAIILYCRQQGIPVLGFADRIAIAAPIGLGLGRIANFINGELWGRLASPDLPWAMIFPTGGPLPRHPSQIYQALLEGLLLLIVMLLLSRREAIRARFGMLTGIFLIGYGIARIIGEFFREPDSFLGFLFAGATMGQLLSIPMLIAGAILVVRARPVGRLRA